MAEGTSSGGPEATPTMTPPQARLGEFKPRGVHEAMPPGGQPPDNNENQPSAPDANEPPELSINQLLQIIAAQQGQIAQIANNVGRLTAVLERAQTIDDASSIDQAPERVEGRSSTFHRIVDRIDELLRQPESPDRETALNNAIAERDKLLDEGAEFGLFNSAFAELSGLLYDARVKVTLSEKEGRDEFQGRGKIQKLTAIQTAAHSDWRIRDSQALQGTRVFTGEARSGFWRSGAVRERFDPIEQRWADHGHPEWRLENRYAGMVDYVYQNGIDTVLDVVKDRKAYLIGYPRLRQKIMDLWAGPVRDPAGHTLKDDDGEDIVAANFNDVRAAIEEARRREPWVPNRLDWETYIRFVADDPEELEEMIPYIVAKVIRKLGTGQPDKLSNRGEQEKERLDGAIANFPVDSERKFRRLKSQLSTNLNAMLAYFFSGKVKDDWNPYLSYMRLLAEGSKDDEQQDHFVDALILDRDGLTMLAAQQFLVNDGEFWRWGEKSAKLATEARDLNKMNRWQVRRRREITRFLMSNKLRKMKDLLNFTVDQGGNITDYGDPKHPAFRRLKKEYDRLDAVDRAANNGNILDADGQPTTETRWQEYCRKALNWENTGEFGDPGEAERVTFQHPLARSFKRPRKLPNGQAYYEFLDMFEVDSDVSQELLDSIRKGKKFKNTTWYERTKLRKVKANMDKAERICRVFMLDSAAMLAWHVAKDTTQLAEINYYLQAAGMEPITMDEAVPQKRLYRALMHSLLREDMKKQPKDRMFKIYYVLTELLDIDIDVPTFAAWYIGANDTGRPTLLLAALERDTGPGSIKESMPAPGKDEKNSGTAWAEKERRLGLLVQLVMKSKFGQSGQFFNFPGHDTKGAERTYPGIKDIRNYMQLMYGTSKDTVWLNDLLPIALPLQQEPPKDYGATEDVLTELVGLHKGGNEVFFAQTGHEGVIENPRDLVSWTNRTEKNERLAKTLTSGNKEGFSIMKDGPLSGAYRWREFDIADLVGKYNEQVPRFFAITDPVSALKKMSEKTYKAGIDLASEVIKPTIIAFKEVVDSTFGPNPGTARFARTLIWYGISKWMDTSWEYRSKPGYAVDANLHLARYFMHQYLLEYGDHGLIYDDGEWDGIMLGTIVKPDGTRSVRYQVKVVGNQQMALANDGKWIVEKVRNQAGQWIFQPAKDAKGNIINDQNGRPLNACEEGLIDAFPKELRDEIINGRDVQIKDANGTVVYTYKDYILPFGLRSKYPETLANYFREAPHVQEDYKGALNQIKNREKVTRP